LWGRINWSCLILLLRTLDWKDEGSKVSQRSFSEGEAHFFVCAL
jgi:hypothetical protein